MDNKFKYNSYQQYKLTLDLIKKKYNSKKNIK